MIHPDQQIEALRREFLDTTNQMNAALSWDNVKGVEECATYAVGLAKAIVAIKTTKTLTAKPSTKS
jgi:hypothetical protein